MNIFLLSHLRINNIFDINNDYNLETVKKLLGVHYIKYSEIIEDEINTSYNNKIPGYLFYSYMTNDILMENGYDGIKHGFVYVVFEPNQIKSVDNDGTYDINDDNIYS